MDALSACSMQQHPHTIPKRNSSMMSSMSLIALIEEDDGR